MILLLQADQHTIVNFHVSDTNTHICLAGQIDSQTNSYYELQSLSI
jgi:hypothetical protein